MDILPNKLLHRSLKDQSKPGQRGQLASACSPHAKVGGWTPGQGTCKNQTMNA